MKIWNLEIVFIEKLTVREFQIINKLNTKYSNKEIDEMDLSNEILKIIVVSINNETDKEKILDIVLNIEDINEYEELNQEIAKIIEEKVWNIKKKNN